MSAPTGGALLVAGTTSDAGKSVLTAGLCRWLARRGIRVAPFKAQNMSNNSVVTPDGGEIGRAQAMQAAAAGLSPAVRFNPVLLKPGSDHRSQIVLHGKVVGEVDAASYRSGRAELAEAVQTGLAELRAEFDVVICEGAGSPAEINLRAGDLANMGLAVAGRLPVIVVSDIDRGGVFAHLYGTLALLDAADQSLIAGFVINKFRGDRGLLEPGLRTLTDLTGRPVYGVLPWSDGLWLDAEDSLSTAADGVLGRPAPPVGESWLRVAVPRLPRMSNPTDLDALACEPGVAVRFVEEPSRLADADLVVLPGSKSTVADLDWLRRTGLAEAVRRHAAAGRPVFGVCGGFQMLARSIDDRVESRRGTVPGLGLLDVAVTFEATKILRTPTGRALGEPVAGYEIHHGRVTRRAAGLAPLVERVRPVGGAGGVGAAAGAATVCGGFDGDHGEGAVSWPVAGTHWHGIFENDAFRRVFLRRVADQAGRPGFRVAADTAFGAAREQQLDLLADLVDAHLDTDALLRLIEHGAPAGLPLLAPGAGA
ncbi:adenosylcobyric acid synthase [Actinoalloteichus hoggarensis]|uniref:cobyric acid synthase n=1 Tax=Actinoalloteichus hoggarensis TaxID=1470176 RepID=UPI0017BC75A6|nr:cobyric acid synthase [Actinoalloteichus hoggarensis]MBB5920585.1 adenosylcobyric acid synthase [Actinoalloteichus hoggarensis]